jgi:hypothetical protein
VSDSGSDGTKGPKNRKRIGETKAEGGK